MHLKEKINGFANLLVITFIVLLIAVKISFFVFNIQIKAGLKWLFKRIISLKAEKA
ncbi:MAG: hypothetical protein ACP5MV_04500 [Candidatus Parvarchaeum sp.]